MDNYTVQQQKIIDGLRADGWRYLADLSRNDLKILADYLGTTAWTIKYRHFASADIMPPAATITALSMLTGINRNVFIAMGNDPRQYDHSHE